MKNLLPSLKRLRDQSGITLLEVLVGGLLSLVVAAGVMEFYIKQHNQWLAQEQVSDMQQSGRAVLEELTRQVRTAGYGISGQPGYVIKGDSLTVYSKPSAKVDTVKFYVDKSDTLHPALMKKVNTASAQLFGENIFQISFSQPATNLLQVTLTARQDRKDKYYAFNSGYRTRDLTTQIKLRNAK